jgi:SAM-dependent MidA family methyltransferase
MREYGAGRGALAVSVSEGVSRSDSGIIGSLKHESVEVESRLPAVDTSRSITGCIVGNEFLDALPVHRVVSAAGALREIHVDWQADRFVEVQGDVSDPRITARVDAGPPLADGQQVEISLRIPEWLSEVASSLDRGYVLLIDYGLPAAELRSASRATGTIRAFRGQHVSGDVLAGVGHQDLTAHIDLDALEADARNVGLTSLGRTTQAEFLMGAGLEDVYAQAREEADADWQSALDLRAAMRRLLDSQHMGSYAVVAFGKGVPGEPPLSGMSFRMPGRA